MATESNIPVRGIAVETEALKALEFYAHNYTTLMFAGLGGNKNIVLGSRPFECRFCGGKPPERTFRKRAHAVSERLREPWHGLSAPSFVVRPRPRSALIVSDPAAKSRAKPWRARRPAHAARRSNQRFLGPCRHSRAPGRRFAPYEELPNHRLARLYRSEFGA
jgi:hypothetical protein